MDRLPPRIVRRLVIAPFAVVLCVALVALSPFVIAIAAVVDVVLRGGGWKTVRLVTFLASYVLLELGGLAWMFVLWLASGFGLFIRSPAMVRAHYGFMRWWLGAINVIAKRLFHLHVYIEERPTPRSGPILVFSRHAGPGNSLLLIGTLMIGYNRHPRIVMLAKLQWEPLYDVMLNRLPNRFIKHDPKRRNVYIDAIADLAHGLADDDAFVLFPEGKDFTPRVRMRAIDYLRGKGHHAAADRAEKMTHVLPPRHNGVIAAMTSAPQADVVLVAHCVLEDIGTFKDLWNTIPFERPLASRYWRIAPEDVPKDEDDLIAWLYDWWERIDGWITAHEVDSSRKG